MDDAAFSTTLYCSSLATSPAQSFSFLRRPIPLQGPVARFDFGAATLRCALACERRAWGGGVLVRDNDGIGACGRFELRTPTPIEQGVFCIPLVAFRLLGRRIRRRQGTYRRAFLASTRAAQIAEHIYMKRGHAYADEEEDEGEASLFNGLPSSGAAPMSDVDAHPPFECIPAVVPHPLVAISEISVGLMKEGSMHARCGTLSLHSGGLPKRATPHPRTQA